MTKELNNWDLFKVIFSDAHVLDIDFSEWDRVVKIIAESDHSEWENGRMPVYEISFLRTSSFRCDYIHEHIELEKGKHCQWHIHDLKKEVSGHNELEFRLISTGPAPDLFIRCKNIKIITISLKLLDTLFGNWNKPYAPFVRPGITKLKSLFPFGEND